MPTGKIKQSSGLENSLEEKKLCFFYVGHIEAMEGDEVFAIIFGENGDNPKGICFILNDFPDNDKIIMGKCFRYKKYKGIDYEIGLLPDEHFSEEEIAQAHEFYLETLPDEF